MFSFFLVALFSPPLSPFSLPFIFSLHPVVFVYLSVLLFVTPLCSIVLKCYQVLLPDSSQHFLLYSRFWCLPFFLIAFCFVTIVLHYCKMLLVQLSLQVFMKALCSGQYSPKHQYHVDTGKLIKFEMQSNCHGYCISFQAC